MVAFSGFLLLWASVLTSVQWTWCALQLELGRQQVQGECGLRACWPSTYESLCGPQQQPGEGLVAQDSEGRWGGVLLELESEQSTWPWVPNSVTPPALRLGAQQLERVPLASCSD